MPLAIGNGKYTRMAGLPNVRDDAGAMALLKAAKFDDVALLHNLDTARLLAPLKAFALKAADADVAAPFYAGHGMEVGGASPSSNSHFYHELR